MKKSMDRVLDAAVQMSLDNPNTDCFVLDVFHGGAHGPYMDPVQVKRKLLRGKYTLFATVRNGEIQYNCRVYKAS